ncbi:hypothetical protein [Sellimonas sp.]|uniref:hypothetical protein n=1 Tax=Sellimonas sp. TaxID=2021466 RepID=UPI00257FE920|nr:hypothetical protein [Sellimonas sp.]
MSNDLISREYLLNHAEYDGNGRLVIPYKTVENAPTAFDREKVISELQEELKLSDTEKERCARENPLQFDSAKGYANGIANSIEIVKKGGIE